MTPVSDQGQKMMITKLFITLLFVVVPFLLASSAVTVEQKHFSLAQIRRFEYDAAPPFQSIEMIEFAHAFLEGLVVQTDPELVREAKRSFLTEIGIISGQKSKKNPKKNPRKVTESNEKVYFWCLFNYPTFQEALELCFTELSAQEAVSFARVHSKYFFQAIPAVLGAIKDFSAFTVADVKIEVQHCTEGSLLDVESAVRTLPVDSLIQCLENSSFELNPRQQVLIKSRVPELIHAAQYDPRLVYQFVLLYDDKSEPFIIKSLEEMEDDLLGAASPPTKSSSKSKKSKKRPEAKAAAEPELAKVAQEEFKIDTESPAKHLLYGNLINVAPIISCESKISPESWKMLVFSYAVYTDTLIEQIFAAIWRSYPNFVGFKEATFVKFHQLLIDDLKKISAERAKLLAVCKDNNLKLLLSVPLSKQVRDALAAVNEETRDILVTTPVTPPRVQQWLWAQVKSPVRQVFPFQVKSAVEIFEAFSNCFCVDRALERFKGGYVVDVFMSHLLFGEPLTETDQLSYFVKTFFIIHVNRYIENFGRIPERFPEVNSSKFKIGRVYELAHAFVSIPQHLTAGNQPIEKYIAEVLSRNTLAQLIQYTVSSDVILKALRDAAEPLEIDGVITFRQEYIYFYNVLQTYPELLGNNHWSYLIENGFCPEAFLVNFTGNMLRHHGDAITLPKLDRLTRGLYALPLEKVRQFIRDSNFMFDEPLRIMECINPDVFNFYSRNPSVESIEFYNMMTPWLNFANTITLHRFKLVESLVDFTAATKDIYIFLNTVVSYLLRLELNYLHLRVAGTGFNSGKFSKQHILQFTIENANRKGLAVFLKIVIDMEGDGNLKPILELVHTCLLAGPLSPARLHFLLVTVKTLEKTLKEQTTPVESINQYLIACKNMLPEQAFDPEVSLETMLASTFRLIKMLMGATRTFALDNEYNELMYSLAILESGHETYRLTSELILTDAIVLAITGAFMNKIRVLCNSIIKMMHLDCTSGEFVTQDWNAMSEDVKEFKREVIRKKLQASGVNITKK